MTFVTNCIRQRYYESASVFVMCVFDSRIWFLARNIHEDVDFVEQKSYQSDSIVIICVFENCLARNANVMKKT